MKGRMLTEIKQQTPSSKLQANYKPQDPKLLKKLI